MLLPAQVYKQSLKGYWSDNYWHKPLKKGADSTGIFVLNYGSGKKRLEGKYNNGTPTGTWKHYYKNGNVAAEVNYTGSYRFWLKNNCLVREGEYKNGKRTGKWKEYYYKNFKKCDSVAYYCVYDFTAKTETWYDYKYKGSEERELLDPYFFNKDLNKYYHRFTDIGHGVQHINVDLLNKSVFDTLPGLHANNGVIAFSQSLVMPRLTRRDIRIELRTTLPNELETGSSSYKLSSNQVLLSFGGDLVKKDAIDVFPFIGLGAGLLQLSYHDTEKNTSETYQRFAGQLNLMLENRLNLKPYTAKWGITLGLKTGYVLEAGGTNWQGEGKLQPITRNKLAGYYAMAIVGLYY